MNLPCLWTSVVLIVVLVQCSLVKAIHDWSRGGALYNDPSFIELNPNYVPSPYRAARSAKAYQNNNGGGGNDGDFEHVYYSYVGMPNLSNQPDNLDSRSIGLVSLMREGTVLFPSLAATVAACLSVFVSWHIPACSNLLQQWFVASRHNLAQGRWLSLVLSAFSHSSFTHIALNLVTLLSFGPAVQRSLQSTSLQPWPMWPLLLGSTLSGSITFLALQALSVSDNTLTAIHRYQGCMGLSAVTCALVAVFCRMNPKAQLRMLLAGLVPVYMTAQVLLVSMLTISFLGWLGTQNSSRGGGVAHAAHLGGLLFGLGYYELWTRRYRLAGKMHQTKQTLFSKSASD